MNPMRPVPRCLLAALALVSASALAEPWEVVVRDRERQVEIDRSSVIQSDSGSKVAWGRIVLTPERAQAEGYAFVKALNRYDCYNRSFFTVKRVYLDARQMVLREESVIDQSPVLAARNSVDERLWQEVCRPPSVADLQKVAREAVASAAAVSDTKLEPAAALAPMPTRAAPASLPANVSRPRPAVPSNGGAFASAPRTVPGAARNPSPADARPPLPRPGSDWSYDGATGPEHWGRLRPEWSLCADGRRQSPIELGGGIAVDLEPLRFDYRDTRFRITDTGQTLRVQVGPGMGVEIRGQRYELEHIQFHRPSVERVGGQASDMVAHFHHRDAAGNVAIVAVLLEGGGDPHPLLERLWGSLPLERGTSYLPTAPIEPAGLLPPRPAHYLYVGSLVTPPCSEGVLWAVMKEPVRVSDDQLAVFARLYPRNGRPIQPLNGRVVLESR